MQDPDNMKATWAGVFSRASATYDHVGPAIFRYYGRRLVALTQIAPGERVLDIASGRGAVLFPAAEAVGKDGHVQGIDIAEGMIRETSSEITARGLAQANLRQMDAESLTFPDASFDAVTCGYAVFFFPNPNRAFAEFRRVLKPGGRITLSTWASGDSQWAWYDTLLNKYLPPDRPNRSASQIQSFNQADGMEAVIRGAGFEDVQVVREAGDFVFPDAETWWSALWSHGARRPLEPLAQDDLDRFKAEAIREFESRMAPDGYHQSAPTLFTLAKRPAN